MDSAKVYGFCDSPSFDFLYYLTHLIQLCERKVLVLDYSLDKELFTYIPNPLKEPDFVSYQGIDYAILSFQEEMIQQYDVIFVYGDLSFLFEFNRLEHIYILTDFKVKSLQYKETIENVGVAKISIVFQDVGSNSLLTFYKNYYMNMHTFWIPHNEIDYFNRIRLLHDGKLEDGYLSKAYCKVLVSIVFSMLAVPKKRIWRYLKKVLGGK